MPPTDALADALRTIPDFPEPGIQYKDITPILSNAALLHAAVSRLATPYAEANITKVVGIEARGFILGPMLARELNAGFVPVRKAGKLPHNTLEETYELEYGTDTIEIHTDALAASDRVLLHDDVLATGGTAAATARLIKRSGATLHGFSFLVELAFLEGRTALDDSTPFHSVLPLEG